MDANVTDDDIDPKKTYSSIYKVGDDDGAIIMHRWLVDFLGNGEYVMYHAIISDNVYILFFNPEGEFTSESLIEAFENWERLGIPNGGIVVLENPNVKKFKTYDLSEDTHFLITKERDKIVVYSKIELTFH